MSLLTDEEIGADRQALAEEAHLTATADTYIGSRTETDDAIHWLGTARLDADQLENVIDWYRETTDHATAIEDIASGDRRAA